MSPLADYAPAELCCLSVSEKHSSAVAIHPTRGALSETERQLWGICEHEGAVKLFRNPRRFSSAIVFFCNAKTRGR